MKLQPYPVYKDSGVAWLGKVPEHWNLIPNRALVRRRKSLVGNRHESYKLLSLTKQGIIIRDLTNLKGKFSADMGTSQEVRPGDLVFCLFDVPETPRTVGLSQHYGMITGAYTVFESLGKCSERFFELFYIAMDDRKLLSPLYSGLRNTIPPTVFLQTNTPVPSVSEQTAIVRFLDNTNRRVNRYIRSKQKLIKLLEEQNQAIIHRAVTRGLDPNVRLKPSGVEWLGDIPEHWEVRRTKYVLREVDERSKTGEEPHLSMSQRLGLIPSSDIEERRLLSESYIGAKVCRENDLVLNRLKAHLGVFALARQDGLVSPDYTVLRPIADISVRYFEMVLRAPACRGELRKRAKGIVQGFWRLYTDDFYDICVPFPPPAEQDLIVQKVDGETEVVESAISRAYREIYLIREYRTRLIADVVTGKLDVCEAAAQLPEEVEEPELTNDEEVVDIDEDEVADFEDVVEEGEV